MRLTWRHWVGVGAVSLVAGVTLAFTMLKPSMPASTSGNGTESRLTGLPAIIATGPKPPEVCPPVQSHDLVPSIELDDLQGLSADWRFLIDENTDAVRTKGDRKAGEALWAAKYLVLFAAPTDAKRLPTPESDGAFVGSMVLIDLAAGAMICQRPLSVHAASATFRELFRREALVVSQELGVRVGLSRCH